MNDAHRPLHAHLEAEKFALRIQLFKRQPAAAFVAQDNNVTHFN